MIFGERKESSLLYRAIKRHGVTFYNSCFENNKKTIRYITSTVQPNVNRVRDSEQKSFLDRRFVRQQSRRGMLGMSFAAKLGTESLRATLIITTCKINPDLFTMLFTTRLCKRPYGTFALRTEKEITRI